MVMSHGRGVIGGAPVCPPDVDFPGLGFEIVVGGPAEVQTGSALLETGCDGILLPALKR